MKKILIIKIILLIIGFSTSLTNLNSQQIVQTFIEENATGSDFGSSVSTTGDVNNDDFDDVIVGAYKYNRSQGRAYIYFGGTNMDNIADVTISGENIGDSFGKTVSNAGDVNNDGYDDVIISSPDFNSQKGKTYIYYGNNNMDNTPDVVMTGDSIGYNFGISASCAGDVNNDGFDDVIVGTQNSNRKVYIFYGNTNMDNIADVILTGENNGGDFGISVSDLGDVNNDGFDDVIVGAASFNSAQGKVYIYYGGKSMDNIADVTITGETTFIYFGNSVSGAGDVNNDGYDDIIVGAYNYTYNYNPKQGRAYIYYGGSNMDNKVDVTFTGEGTNNYFGSSVSDLGDVNNDGFDDVIVGAYGFNSQQGRAYVFLGDSKMDNSADVIFTGETVENAFGISVSGAGDINQDGYKDIIIGAKKFNTAQIYIGGNSLDNFDGVLLSGETTDMEFGFSISGAGDVNGDGYDDIIVGAYNYNKDQGRAYIYYGGKNMDSFADVIITGEKIGDNFGWSVSRAGDVNNDGFDDVIIGAYGFSTSMSKEIGRAYLYYGGKEMDNNADVTMTGESVGNNFGFNVSQAGDVNNDGYDDVIVARSGYSSSKGKIYIYYGSVNMDNIVDLTITGKKTNYYFIGLFLSACDVNNDQFDDIIFTSVNFSSELTRVEIYYGSANMDDVVDVILTGETKNDFFGYSVSSAGDVNNDGYDDVIVGSPEYNATTGRVYIFFGGTNMDNIADVTITGDTTGNSFGNSVSNAGDINNDGYNDVIVGGFFGGSQQEKIYIYFGGNIMDNKSDVIIDGENTNSYFGFPVSSAGDVNNDGYDDIIIGAHKYPANGKIYVYTLAPNTGFQFTELSLNYFNAYQGSDKFIYLESKNILLNEFDISLHDLNGKNLFNTKSTGNKTKIQKIFPEGIYTISINQNGKRFSKKMLITSF